MAKVVNYTPEQVELIVKGYRAGTPAEKLAEQIGKTTRSVIAKLVKENVYVAEAKTVGKRAMLKAGMVSEIAKLLGKDEDVLGSLEKATGPALMAVLEGLRK